jgi:guanosine-3',5'-bis(diphosphate) 3'-pyrophosphohydrolase
MEVQTLYQEALKFATYRHLEKKQKVNGTNLPYVVHLSNVAMEIFIAAHNTDCFDLSFAVQVALLHDTLEDTLTEYEEIKKEFGLDIADAVLALTKDNQLPEEQQTQDSLTRIKKLQEEVWAVKLAERITNLQTPPTNWKNHERLKYQAEARLILNELKYGNGYLAKRLKEKIEEYGEYIDIKTQIQEDYHG